MVFREKKKISHFRDEISRAAFSFLRIFQSNMFISGFQPEVQVDQYPSGKPF